MNGWGSEEIETKNAKITSTFLGINDIGVFTFTLYLDYGGNSQGAGMYALGGGQPREYCSMHIIEKILEVVGVDSWEELKGKHIRAKGNNHHVQAIGNILKDEWLDFDVFFKAERALADGVKE